jgi:AP2 domain
LEHERSAATEARLCRVLYRDDHRRSALAETNVLERGPVEVLEVWNVGIRCVFVRNARFGMMTIPLTNGSYALIDDQDEALMSAHSWYREKHGKTFYAMTNLGHGRKNRKTIRMHRLILPGIPRIDHWNGNGLDNRRENLRPCSSTQNHQNIRDLYANNKSGFKGVHFDRARSRWVAQIRVNGKQRFLGRFPSAEQAAAAYDSAAKKFFVEFAAPNTEVRK